MSKLDIERVENTGKLLCVNNVPFKTEAIFRAVTFLNPTGKGGKNSQKKRGRLHILFFSYISVTRTENRPQKLFF